MIPGGPSHVSIIIFHYAFAINPRAIWTTLEVHPFKVSGANVELLENFAFLT